MEHGRWQSAHRAPSDSLTWLSGFMLLVSTFVGFVAMMYWIALSKLMPVTGNKFLDWIREDRYYCLLVTVTMPVMVLTVVINWLGMKFFRHN